MSATDLDTVPELLAERVEEHGPETYLITEDVEWTYEQLDERSDRVAGAFRDSGVEKGDRVCILMDNRAEFLALWHGIAKIGAVMVTLNTRLQREGLVHNVSVAEPKAFVLGGSYVRKYERIADEIPDVDLLYAEQGTDLRETTALSELFEAPPREQPPGDSVALSRGDPMSIIFTSGTTGPPKGVVLPHYSYVNSARQVSEIIYEVRDDDRFFTCLPLYHCNAQMLTSLPAMYAGVDVAIVDQFSASRFIDQLREYDATIFNYLGMMIKAIYKQDPRPDDADNPARVAFGVPTPEDIWTEFEDRFDVELFEGYGATETGCACASGSPRNMKVGSCGKPFDDNEIAILDDEGRELPPGEVGEIVMRPGQTNTWMTEYFGNPEATVEAWQDLWLHLDDLGYIDEDGWLHYVGRKSSVIRHRGENITPTEIEGILESHDAVEEAAVVGVESDMTEEDVKAFVVASGTVTEQDLIDLCEPRLASFKIPRYVKFVAEIPKTATNKIRRAELQDRDNEGAWDRLAE
jgi:acyl-CoA synthetase (AMP-forming)/AMP-acid ligase II